MTAKEIISRGMLKRPTTEEEHRKARERKRRAECDDPRVAV